MIVSDLAIQKGWKFHFEGDIAIKGTLFKSTTSVLTGLELRRREHE